MRMRAYLKDRLSKDSLIIPWFGEASPLFISNGLWGIDMRVRNVLWVRAIPTFAFNADSLVIKRLASLVNLLSVAVNGARAVFIASLQLLLLLRDLIVLKHQACVMQSRVWVYPVYTTRLNLRLLKVLAEWSNSILLLLRSLDPLWVKCWESGLYGFAFCLYQFGFGSSNLPSPALFL